MKLANLICSFVLQIAIQKRKLDRQIGSTFYERSMLSDAKHKELLVSYAGMRRYGDPNEREFQKRLLDTFVNVCPPRLIFHAMSL